jgi:electron transfer flavoprotein beta subunit
MRIAVFVKQAIDESELKFDASGKAILENTQTKISTFDKNAVEEALRIKSLKGGEVIVFSAGNNESKKALKEALAMGADRAVHIFSERKLSALSTSKLLSKAVLKYMPVDLFLLSEGSSDTYTSLVPGQVSVLLGIPFIPFAKKIDIIDNRILVVQSLEQKTVHIESSLPAVVSVVSEINQPRYPTLVQIMQAARKQIEEIKDNEIGISETNYSVEDVRIQSVERKRIIFEGPPEETARKLFDALVKEGVIRK